MADQDWDQTDSDNPLPMQTDGAVRGGLVQVRMNACVKKGPHMEICMENHNDSHPPAL